LAETWLKFAAGRSGGRKIKWRTLVERPASQEGFTP